MESPDATTWAPRSPDLSSYHSAEVEPIHPQHQGYRGSISHSFTPSQSYQLNSTTQPFSPPASSPGHPHPVMPRGVKKEASMDDADYIPDAPQARVKAENGGATSLAGTEHIEVRTKFPVARIKRIMQADDDVGKVAQVTPVAVSKALELFMISLITKSAAEAKSRSSKRVNVAHLKSAVQKDEQFDFLSEIVSKVADAPAAAEKNEDSMEVEGKKKKGGRRKKKEEDDF